MIPNTGKKTAFPAAFFTRCGLVLLCAALLLSVPGCKKTPPPSLATAATLVAPPALPMVNTFSIGDYTYREGTTHESWDQLLAKNKDTRGWITIDGTKVDYPVVQGTDNAYYLEHGPDHKKKPAGRGFFGSIFMDYRTKIKPDYMSQNVVIYGHRLGASGAMFTHLKYYLDLNRYKSYPYIKFDTPYATHTWQIFAVLIIDATPDREPPFDFRQPEYDTEEDFLTFVRDCKRRSIFNLPVEVGPKDRILTLQTCTYEIEDARLVVMARLVNPGENIAVDVSKAEVNPEPLYPAAWYRKYGGKKPYFPD